MKFVIVFAALVAVCAAVPVALSPDAGAETLVNTRSNDGIHGYDFNFETSNGISRKETGVLKPAGEVEVIVVNGASSWTAPGGEVISLQFVADENGYQPVL